MAARLIAPNEPIEVKQICALCYGQPGSKKTSMAQTAENPITLAFDPGIYRAFGRKGAAVFDTWGDVLGFDLKPYSTIVVDTIGMCLDRLALAVIAESPKHGNRLGGLSLQGYGVLKTQFAAWVNSIKERGQDIVFLAHEKAEKNGDESYYCPDIVGGSYQTLMNHCDMVGYLHFANGKRVVDFAPTDRWMAKVPPWGRDPHIELPDFGAQPTFLRDLLTEAKASMGRISAEGAKVAQVVQQWATDLEEMDLATLNAILPTKFKELQNGTKAQVWKLIEQYAARAGWVFDYGAKAFRAPQGAVPPPPPPPDVTEPVPATNGKGKKAKKEVA